jgi:hypothetical protein
MQQMHQGQLLGPANSGQGSPPIPSANASSLDDLVSGAARDVGKANAASTVEALHGEKKAKKEKEKNVKLVYSDNDVSPEEKMARLPRYAFVPEEGKDPMAGDATATAS